MLLLALTLAASPVSKVVEIEGRSFRVETSGETVRVSQKAVFTKVSLVARARMRAAVQMATGCSIVDDYWNVTDLEGQLDCPSSPGSPAEQQ